MKAELDVIALARTAGLCIADCHFLDADPFENLFEVLGEMGTEEEREFYIAAVRREDRQRRERLHQLECFAAAVLKTAAAAAHLEVKRWGEEGSDLCDGGSKVCKRLEFAALELEARNAAYPG